jgi:hypothetical protein
MAIIENKVLLSIYITAEVENGRKSLNINETEYMDGLPLTNS